MIQHLLYSRGKKCQLTAPVGPVVGKAVLEAEREPKAELSFVSPEATLDKAAENNTVSMNTASFHFRFLGSPSPAFPRACYRTVRLPHTVGKDPSSTDLRGCEVYPRV